MVRTTPAAATVGAASAPTPRMLSHLAYVTPDAEATVDFYTRVMGMEFVLAVMDDEVPSTGAPIPYFHIFFRLGDGSTLAFFEAPGVPPRPPAPHPAYDTFDHLALQVDSTAEVDAWRDRLTGMGLEVLGPVDHKIIYSVYFRDPVNGLRLEITTPLVPDWNDRSESARAALADWSQAKRRARENGTASAEEALAVISARRHRDG
ncbi:VOC family protein [Actinomadura sp. SCN-SB]|uniref:VOC family protein n=1 Tax=Actinomadura sp. SCN-SB TaxID=3373092 RepID=UPI00375203D4